jgi:hypothetical protein
MTRMFIVPASLALAVAVGACGSGRDEAATGAAQPQKLASTQATTQPAGQPAASKRLEEKEKAKQKAIAALPPKERAKHVYGVIGPKPKPLPPDVEALTGSALDQALAGSIKRSVAWGNAFYGETVLDGAAHNHCEDRGPNRWSCAVTIKVVKPFKGYKAGTIPGGYTVSLDPSTKKLTYSSGLS